MHRVTALRSARMTAVALLLVLGSHTTAWGSGEQMTRVVPVARGTRLDVRVYGGDVVVRGARRDEVRVRAERFGTDELIVTKNGDALEVRVRHDRGPAHAVDLDLEVPEWMSVTVKGTYLDVSASGVHGGVVAESVRGDVRIRDCVGPFTLTTVEGTAVVEECEGSGRIHAVNNEVRVTGFRGDLVIDSVNGAVTLRRIEASAVTVGTMGGSIAWDGQLRPAGRYQFATHEGDIDLDLGTVPSAAVSVRLFDGEFRSSIPTGLDPAATRAKRFAFRIGSGAATLELETFRGVISLRESPTRARYAGRQAGIAAGTGSARPTDLAPPARRLAASEPRSDASADDPCAAGRARGSGPEERVRRFARRSA